MKKYTLIKKYPSLPFDWKEGMEVVKSGRSGLFTKYYPCSSNYGDGFLEDEDDVNKIINNNESRESISTYRDNRLD